MANGNAGNSPAEPSPDIVRAQEFEPWNVGAWPLQTTWEYISGLLNANNAPDKGGGINMPFLKVFLDANSTYELVTAIPLPTDQIFIIMKRPTATRVV
jgi:hypothetical protein